MICKYDLEWKLGKISFWLFFALQFIHTIYMYVYAQLLGHVWLFVTPWTIACQTPLSMEFSRQENWSCFCALQYAPGMPLHLHSAAIQSCPILCHPVDCSPPAFSIHGILQARILERVAISSPGYIYIPIDKLIVASIKC